VYHRWASNNRIFGLSQATNLVRLTREKDFARYIFGFTLACKTHWFVKYYYSITVKILAIIFDLDTSPGKIGCQAPPSQF